MVIKMNKTRFCQWLLLISLLYSGTGNAIATELWVKSYQLEAMGNYAQAAQSIAPLIRHRPDHEFAIIRHAWLNHLQGKYNEAIGDYTTSLKINGKSLDAKLGITLPLLAQKRWRKAAFYATEVLAIAP